MLHSLLSLQNAFQQHLLSGEPGISAAVRPGGAIPVARRLQIYHRAYRARLVDALRDSFGHTARYLGDEGFEHGARAYIEAHPSSHSSLNDYGIGFAAWLADQHPQDPDIAELASLDWALRRAFDGPDAPVLTLTDLGALAPEAWGQVGLTLHPTCQRLVLQHNALALWQALDQDQALPPAVAQQQTTDLLVWRRGHQPHFRSLGALEGSALDALQQGQSFAGLCEALAHRYPDVDTAVQAGTLLRRWVDEELLSALRF